MDGSDASPQPAATVPYSVKYDAKYWLNEGDHNAIVSDPVVSKAVLLFFDSARSII